MLYMPADDSDPANEADPGVLSWTEELRRVTVAVSKKDRRPAASRSESGAGQSQRGGFQEFPA